MSMHPRSCRARAFACALLVAGLAGGALAAGKEVKDLFAAGGHVKVDQPVTGDAFVAGGSVEVRAPVSDRVRAAGGEVLVDSAIGSKVTVAGGKVWIGPDAVIGGDASLYGGEVTVDGRVEGDMDASAGQVILNGQVRGDVVARAGSVRLGPDARIGGTLRYTSGTLQQADGAVIVGAVVRDVEHKPRRSYTFKGPGRGLGLIFYGIVVGLAALLIAIAPKFGARAADRAADSPAAMAALGFVAIIGLPIAMLLLCVTIIGIPVAFALGAAVPVILVLAFTLGVLGLGRRLPAMFKQAEPQQLGGQVLWFALALAAVMVVGTVPILGALVMGLFLLAGLGAFAMELPRRRSAGPSGGAPAAPRTAAA